MPDDPNAAMAVIRAARAFVQGPDRDGTLNALIDAVRALDHKIDHDMTGPTEIPWADIMPGDQLKADRGDNFYPVEHVAPDGDKVRATVIVKGQPTALLRRRDRVVTVVRGPEGVVFDLLRTADLGPSLIDEENHS